MTARREIQRFRFVRMVLGVITLLGASAAMAVPVNLESSFFNCEDSGFDPCAPGAVTFFDAGAGASTGVTLRFDDGGFTFIENDPSLGDPLLFTVMAGATVEVALAFTVDVAFELDDIIFISLFDPGTFASVELFEFFADAGDFAGLVTFAIDPVSTGLAAGTELGLTLGLEGAVGTTSTASVSFSNVQKIITVSAPAPVALVLVAAPGFLVRRRTRRHA